jgi:starvation-inducible outer membrane lipoprotein
MNRSNTGLLVVSLCLVLLSSCSTHPRKVDCESHLTPINAPAPSSHSKDHHP